MIDYLDNKTRLRFNGGCLKQQNKPIYTHSTIVNILFMSFWLLAPWPRNCLFGAVKLTKNADIDKYRYSSYGIRFYRKGSFSFPGDGFGQNVIIFMEQI